MRQRRYTVAEQIAVALEHHGNLSRQQLAARVGCDVNDRTFQRALSLLVDSRAVVTAGHDATDGRRRMYARGAGPVPAPPVRHVRHAPKKGRRKRPRVKPAIRNARTIFVRPIGGGRELRATLHTSNGRERAQVRFLRANASGASYATRVGIVVDVDDVPVLLEAVAALASAFENLPAATLPPALAGGGEPSDGGRA